MPPICTITPKILDLISGCAHQLGLCEGLHLTKPFIALRRENRIKSIQGTCAIEGNDFVLEDVTALLDGKKVLGPEKQILEIQNAIQAYESLASINPYSEKSFLRTHKILMSGLIEDSGKYRSKNIGVLHGSRVKHVAPKPIFVPKLMGELFQYAKKENSIPKTLLATIIHYEIEFIHPFQDGNGRMGRLWQTAILSHEHPIFLFLPFETLIKKNQKSYYAALGESDSKGDAASFAEFMLEVLFKTLQEIAPQNGMATRQSFDLRIQVAKDHFEKSAWFSRKDYQKLFPTLSTATASRDLAYAVQSKILSKQGEKALTLYCFKK